MQKSSRQIHIVISKEQRQQRDLTLVLQIKQAKKQFFTSQIRSMIQEMTTPQKEEDFITELFQKKKIFTSMFYGSSIKSNQPKFQEQRKQIKQMLNSINEQYIRRKRECSLLQQIVKLKNCSLRSLKVQYSSVALGSNISLLPYEISAFDLFKIVHENRSLVQLIIKGVQVQQFQQFIGLINVQNRIELFSNQREEATWVSNFKPSKQLQIQIDAQVQFQIQSEKILSLIEDLSFFINLISQLRNITAKISIPQGKWDCSLPKVWECLQKVKKIKIQIFRQPIKDSILQNQASFLRSMLLGGLTSFTEITHLSFENIRFHLLVTNPQFLAMEEILSTIFQHNKIVHLGLAFCGNFPLFPQMSDIHSIDLSDTTFRTQLGFKDYTQSNPLRFIRVNAPLPWTIRELLFDELQSLFIYQTEGTQIGNIQSKSPSKLEFLGIWNSFAGNLNCLSAIFPKLFHLTYLELSEIDIGHEILCTIPSPYLEELYIISNKIIIDEGLKEIDTKWPHLRHLRVMGCRNLTEEAWKICQFEGLIILQISEKLLGEGKRALPTLRNKGIEVQYY